MDWRRREVGTSNDGARSQRLADQFRRNLLIGTRGGESSMPDGEQHEKLSSFECANDRMQDVVNFIEKTHNSYRDKIHKLPIEDIKDGYEPLLQYMEILHNKCREFHSLEFYAKYDHYNEMMTNKIPRMHELLNYNEIDCNHLEGIENDKIREKLKKIVNSLQSKFKYDIIEDLDTHYGNRIKKFIATNIELKACLENFEELYQNLGVQYGSSNSNDGIEGEIQSLQGEIDSWHLPKYADVQNMTLLEKSRNNLELPMVQEMYDVHHRMNKLALAGCKYIGAIATRFGVSCYRDSIGEEHLPVDQDLVEYCEAMGKLYDTTRVDALIAANKVSNTFVDNTIHSLKLHKDLELIGKLSW